MGVPHTRGDGPNGTAVRGMVNVVFPTRVGMDRSLERRLRRCRSVPHTRGDGPSSVENRRRFFFVFPTRVGMDRGFKFRDYASALCSPHAWGWTGADGAAV